MPDSYQEQLVLGAHLHLGAAGDGDASTKPSQWYRVGPIQTLTIEPVDETHEWYVPTPGVKYRAGKTAWQVALDFKAVVIYGGWALWSLLMKNNSELTAGGDYTGAGVTYSPLKDPNYVSWAKLEYYSQSGIRSHAVDFYAHMSISTGPELGDGGVQYEIAGSQLHSEIQSGTVVGITSVA